MREQPEQVAAQVALLEAAVPANLLKARETIEAARACQSMLLGSMLWQVGP